MWGVPVLGSLLLRKMLVLLGRRSWTSSTSNVSLAMVHRDTNAPALPCSRATPSGVITPLEMLPPIS